MKKFIAILLSLSIIFTLGIPAFAAEEETEITQELHEEIEEPTVTTEELLELVQTEEVQEKLEEEGVSTEEIEDNIENGNYEVILITQEEFEKMRIDSALSIMGMSALGLAEGFLMLLLIPAAPILFFIPFVGPLATGVILAAPLAIIQGLGFVLISPILAIYEYKNFELGPIYEIVE